MYYFWITLLVFGQCAYSLTLHEAQEILFKNNSDLKLLSLEVERTREQVQESKASLFPTIDAFSNYGYTSETSKLKLALPFPPPAGTLIGKSLGDHDKIELGIDATYPIFTGFARGNNLQSKRESLLAKEAQWRSAHNQLSMKLGALYYGWQISKWQATYQEKVLSHSQALAKQLQDFVKAGTGVRSRALAAEAKSKAAEVDLLSAQNMRDSIGYELLDFLGSRDTNLLYTTLPQLDDSLEVIIPDWETNDLGNSETRTRSETEALDHAVAQGQFGQKALAGQRYPQLFAMAGYRYANPGLNLNEDEFMAFGIVGFQLRWNLFDGFKNNAQRKQLELQTQGLREQKAKLASEWWKAERLARIQFYRWQAQFQSAKASHLAADAADTDLKRQFEVGLATGLDWLEARNQAARALMLMSQAKTMQQLALLQWRFAVGKELRY